MPKNAADWSKRYPGWALVTGASSGIGLHLANGFARRGMPVALVARRAELLDSIASRIREESGVETLAIPLDLSSRDFLPRLVEALGDRPVAALANNAGFGLAEAFHQQDPERLRQMVELNCVAPVVLSRHFVEPMIERKNGAILTVSSIAGLVPCPYFSAYAATKAFDLFLGEGLWGELKPLGIDCLTLCPGLTETEFQSVSGTNVKKKNYGHDPRDVAEAALNALGKRPTWVHGASNRLMTALPRFLPRAWVARLAQAVGRKLLKPEALARLQAQERDPPRA